MKEESIGGEAEAKATLEQLVVEELTMRAEESLDYSLHTSYHNAQGVSALLYITRWRK